MTYKDFINPFVEGSVQYFQTKAADASWMRSLIWLSVAGFVGSLMSLLSAYSLTFLRSLFKTLFSDFDRFRYTLFMFPTDSLFLRTSIRVIISNAVMNVIAIPLVMVSCSLLVFLLARMIGGNGSFETQTYLLSTFMAPGFVIGNFIVHIPYIGWLMALALVAYQGVLAKRVLQAVHLLSPGRATIVVVGILTTLLVFIVVFFAIAWYLFDSGDFFKILAYFCVIRPENGTFLG